MISILGPPFLSYPVAKRVARGMTLTCHTNAVAHPNVPELMIRVQTDGSISPKEVMLDTCKNLIASYGQLGREFTREYELRRMVGAGDQENGANGHV